MQILTADHPRDAADPDFPADGDRLAKLHTLGALGGGASFCRASPSATMR
ncbi:MAG: hypothetical protein ACK47T_08635 [Brevundimonas sp.]